MMSEPLKLYAIEATHTTKGKLRKRRRWAGVHKLTTEPWQVDCGINNDAELWRQEAEQQFRCTCRVVEFVEKKP